MGRLSTTLLLYKWGLKDFGDFQLETRTAGRAQQHRLDSQGEHQWVSSMNSDVKSRKWYPATAKAQRMLV